ncbi:PREDICTED: uncharacterized protein LOC109157602 [Ipomoea nil]|uniref:uncharacterized protein LOC109157602 n=1 Tax=Ipomoea nil TaxID=35883 RepID=UPI0009019DDD|nr:PREDICTED: uncharacterized protein LOC109157602 [Ipomoea nil]
MYVLDTKLSRLKKALDPWSKETFGNIFSKLQELEDKVQVLEKVFQQNPDDDRALIDYKESVALLHRQVSIEEEYWQQKAHMVAVQEGDRNSKFFHSMVKERRRKLYIHKVKDDTGQWIEDRQGIAQNVVSFFEGLFTTEAGTFDLSKLDCVPRLVTDIDNAMLIDIPEEDEIINVVFAMNSEIVKGDVVNMVRSYFLGREITRSITHTSIVLLPKRASPETFVDYRPISLCNFSSKIVTKLMGKDVVLKLDMAKAYDRVSWFFLVSVMRRMGFSEVWIDLVYRAVSNVWYSVIVNGVKEGFFTSSRGLRQGDPLSPSLFIIAAEILSMYIARVHLDEGVPRFSQPAGTPHIHHLAYADDVIIFSTGRQGTICKVIRALKDYEDISGQMVSFPKSAFYMHPNTLGPVIRRIRDITRCIHRSFPFTYLGCPIYVKRKKCVYFSSVVDKVKAKCLGWQRRLLSKGGKAVLITSVLQAIPLHLFAACAPK